MGEALFIYWHKLFDCGAQNRSTGSMLGFCGLVSSIGITHIVVAMGPRRFCGRGLCHIMLQGMGVDFLGATGGGGVESNCPGNRTSHRGS